MGRYQNPLNIGSLAAFVDSVKSANFQAIDLRLFDFVDVYATMGLALLVRNACQEGHTPTIYLPVSDDVRSYLARQDFFEIISPWYTIPRELLDLKQRQWAGNPRVAPLTLIESEDDVSPVVNRVRDLLTSPQFSVSKPMADDIWRILGEALQNVPQHAGVGTGRLEPGIAVLQAYKGCVEVALGDTGVGLRASLSQNPASAGRTDAELQMLVLQQGFSRTGKAGQGNGLCVVGATITKLGGVLRLQSGCAVTFITAMGYRQKPCRPFPGTQLWIRLPCRT